MLDFAVLGLLYEAPMHGYELRKQLGARLGGFRAFSYGSLYPALQRLLKEKLVKAEWTVSPSTNRRVRVYQITKTGLHHLESEMFSFDRMLEGIQMVLGPARRAANS